MRYRPTVEVHSWSRDQYKITDWVTRLEVSHGVSQPWSSISLVMKPPVARWTELTPRQSDWLVVRDKQKRAIAWGYVSARSGGIGVRGDKVVVKDTSVRTIDWLELMGLVEIYVAPGLIAQQSDKHSAAAAKHGVLPTPAGIGTLIPIKDWKDPATGPWNALIMAAKEYFADGEGGRSRRPIGFALQEFVKTIVRVLVPRTLSAEYLASQLRTVYDEAGVKAYAPDRRVEPVLGKQLSGLTTVQSYGTTVQSMLMRTFIPDLNLVEVFSSLEGPGVVESSHDPVDRRLRDEFRQKDYEPAYDVTQPPPLATAGLGDPAVDELNRRREEEEAGRTDEERYGRKLASGLADTLGRNPVLIYRMRPWRSVELGKFIEQAPAAAHEVALLREGAEIVAVNQGSLQHKLSADLFDLDMFPGTTWRLDDAPRVDADAVIDFDTGQNDAAHANTVTIGLPAMPDHPVRFQQRLGLPYYSDQAILARGCRLYQPQWPFFPPVDERDKSKADVASYGSVLRSMRTIALLATQIMAGADRFETGQIFLDYSPQVVFGRPLRVGLPTSVPGRTNELVCYVRRVTHIWESIGDRGEKTIARTVLLFERGLFDEELRAQPISFAGPGGVS